MEIPECSICLQSYDEEEHCPRVLSCGHSPCHSCLNELPRHWTDSSSSVSASASASCSSNNFCLMRCPECTQWVKLPLQGPSALPKNIELLRVIDSQHPQGMPKKKTHRFTEHKPLKFNNLFALDNEPCTDWTNWVISQGAIQLRTAQEEEDEILLTGSLMVSTHLKEQMVSLMPIGAHHVTTTCPAPSPKGDSYPESIRQLLENLTKSERKELHVLMRHSLLNRKVCRVLGFWMSSKGLVYLVCEKLQRLQADCIQSALPKLGFSDISQTPRRWQLENLKWATEICEVVVSLHTQDLICGCLAPECFEFDEFGHPLFSLHNALLSRRRLKELIRNAVRHNQSGKTDQKPKTISTSSLLYLSPEVLSILHQNEQGCTSDEIRSCSSGSVPEITVPISFKADVWSLGCLLLMLLVGESPFNGLSLSDFFRAIVKERRTIDNWMDNKLSSKTLFSPEEISLKTQFEHFKHLLCKCFEYEPKSRPDAYDLWRCLIGWSTSSEQPFREIYCFNPSNKGCWCLVLGDSLSSLSAEIESCGEQGAIDVSPQENNGPGNKLKDADLNESKVIDAQGTGESMLNTNGGTELKMDELEAVTLEGHLDCVTALAVCGEYLLSASYDKTLCIWSLHTNSHLGTLRGHEHRILALVVNSEESLCFSADYGGCIFVWDIDSVPRQEPVMTWYDHKDWRYSGVHSLAVSKDGYLYSGSGDRTVKAWSLQDYSLFSTMEGHKSVVSALYINEGLLYSGSWDGTVRLWWLRDHSPLAVLGANAPVHVSSVHALAMCNDILIAVYNNGWVQIWKDDILLKSLQVHNSAILALDGKDDCFFTGGWDKTIKAFNVNKITENPTPKVIDCNSVVTSLLFHQGKLIIGFAEKVIKITKFC